MKQQTVRSVLVAIIVGAILLPASISSAEDFDCPPSRGTEVVDGNIVVVGACSLDGTLVKGNVFLEDNGDLLAGGVTIIGNVQTDGAERVRIRFSDVGGDIQLTGVDGLEHSEVLDSIIGGTLDVADNPARFELKRNVVDSDLKANVNVGGVAIRFNEIGGNLQCQGNVPPPTGGDNIVDGNKEDQCENLQPDLTTTTTLPVAGTCGDHNEDGDVGATDALIVLHKAVGRDVELVCPLQEP